MEEKKGGDSCRNLKSLLCKSSFEAIASTPLVSVRHRRDSKRRLAKLNVRRHRKWRFRRRGGCSGEVRQLQGGCTVVWVPMRFGNELRKRSQNTRVKKGFCCAYAFWKIFNLLQQQNDVVLGFKKEK